METPAPPEKAQRVHRCSSTPRARPTGWSPDRTVSSPRSPHTSGAAVLAGSQQQPAPVERLPRRRPRPPQQAAAPSSRWRACSIPAKGPNAFLRQIKRNLLPRPEDAGSQEPGAEARLRRAVPAMAQMRGQKGLVQPVETVDGTADHFNDLASIDPVERISSSTATGDGDPSSPHRPAEGTAGIVSPTRPEEAIMLQPSPGGEAGQPSGSTSIPGRRAAGGHRHAPDIKAEVLSSSDRPTGDHLGGRAGGRARRMVESEGRDPLDPITGSPGPSAEVDRSGRTSPAAWTAGAGRRRIFGAARATEEATMPSSARRSALAAGWTR